MKKDLHDNILFHLILLLLCIFIASWLFNNYNVWVAFAVVAVYLSYILKKIINL